MSAERMPQEETSLLAGLLVRAVGLVLRAPRTTVAVAALAAGAAAAYAAGFLEIQTPRPAPLLKEEASSLWLDHVARFGEADDLAVVVAGRGRNEVAPVLGELAAAIQREPGRFEAVLHRVDLAQIRAKGLYYLPLAELQKIDGFLASVEPVYRGQWARLSVGNGIGQFAAESALEGPAGAAAREHVARMVRSLQRALGSDAVLESPWPALIPETEMARFADPCLLADDGRLGMVVLRLAPREAAGFAQNTADIDALRQLLDTHQRRHPEVKIGLTGLPVMENDAMRSSVSSMRIAGCLSAIAALALSIVVLRGFRHPLMAGAVLVLAVAWSFGYATLVAGHLNILSVAFAVILIALGIGYSIQMGIQYLSLRADEKDVKAAILAATAAVGPRIVVGAGSTAAAFFAMALTGCREIAEMGLIAGGGLLLCLAGSLWVLPPLVLLVDSRRGAGAVPTPLDSRPLVQPCVSRPRLAMLLALACLLVLATGIGSLRFDPNYFHLQPGGAESVALENKLLQEGHRSATSAVSTGTDPQELLTRKERFLKLSSVERVDEIVSLLVPDAESKRPLVQRIHQRVTDVGENPPLIPVEPPDQLIPLFRQVQAILAPDPQAAGVCVEIDRLCSTLAAMPLPVCTQRLAEYQQYAAGDLLRCLAQVEAASDPEPPALIDLPESVLGRFVGRDGSHLLRVYGRGGMENQEAMARFVQEVQSVDGRVTGWPVLACEASLATQRSYQQAAWYALAVIVTLLCLDFGSLRHVLLAVLPTGAAIAMLLGLMGWMDMPLNQANLIAIPVILGLGVSAAVPVVHEYLDRPGPYRMSVPASGGLALGPLAAMVCSGAMLLADPRGIQSLGRVLTLGAAMVAFCSLGALPALLEWLSCRREVDGDVTALSLLAPEPWDQAGDPQASPPCLPLHRRTERLGDIPADDEQRAA